MPPPGRMADYPAFPPAIRRDGVGCIRVAHPSATLAPPKGSLPSDLHVLGLPLAFILSQDQTLRCTIVFFFLFYSESRVPPSFSCVPYSRVRDLASTATRTSFLCWPQAFKELSRSRIPSTGPLVPSESGCKSTTFFRTGKHFFHLFFIFLLSL